MLFAMLKYIFSSKKEDEAEDTPEECQHESCAFDETEILDEEQARSSRDYEREQ